VESYFEGSDIDLDDVAPIVIPEGLPWLDPGPIFGFELAPDTSVFKGRLTRFNIQTLNRRHSELSK
jgi:hypothetical protein